MFRVLPLSVLLVASAPLIAMAIEGSGRSVMASCADGSVMFATRWEDVHCAGAARMPPGHIPRVGSESDRSLALAWEREDARGRDLEHQIAAAVVPRSRSSLSRSVSLALTPRAQKDLRQLLALGRAPAAAAIEYEPSVGVPHRMRLAHARWLEDRLHHAFAYFGVALAGPVLTFQLDPSGTPSAPVPSFAQGGITFRPDPADPRQLGWIAAGSTMSWRGAPHLGYVVLPAGFDVMRPIAIFWGDAVAATRPFRPAAAFGASDAPLR